MVMPNESPRPQSAPIILLVEMNPSTRLLFTDGMVPYGFSILAVSNGAEAVEILGKENGVRAVFLNLQLSGHISALVLARWIAVNRPDLPVICGSEAGIAPQIGHSGANYRKFVEPYDIAAIAEHLSACIEQRATAILS